MANDYFFQHDYNPTNDPKIQAMYADYGDWGYGLFWRLIEALHRDENHRLPAKPYLFKAFAQHPSTSVEQVQTFVTDCINLYELLLTDNGLFYSARVDRNVQKRAEISALRSAAGKASALAKQMSTSVEQNPTKEKKGKEKEKKENGTAVAFVAPALSEVVQYFSDKGYSEDGAKRAFDYYSESDWKDSKGAQVRNWKQKMIAVWFKPEYAKVPPKPPRYDPTGFLTAGPQRRDFYNQRDYDYAVEQFNLGKPW